MTKCSKFSCVKKTFVVLILETIVSSCSARESQGDNIQQFPDVPRLQHPTCYFEDGRFCNWWRAWPELTGTDCQWHPIIVSEVPESSQLNIPSNKNGVLEYDANKCSSEHKEAAIISDVLADFKAPSQCLRFRYMMTGDVGSLSVKLVPPGYSSSDGANPRIEFMRKGHQGRLWHTVSVTLDSHGEVSYQLVISATAGARNNGVISLDEIVHFDGACLDDRLCDFDSSVCGYKSNVDSLKFAWTQQHAEKYVGYDHSFSAPEGHILVADGTSHLYRQTAIIQSPKYELKPSSEGHCFTFWYQTPVFSSGGALPGWLTLLRQTLDVSFSKPSSRPNFFHLNNI